MKKTLFSIIFLAVSCCMMATPSKITMLLSSPAGANDRLTLFEDAEFSADFDEDYDATKNMNSGLTFSSNLYVSAAWGTAQGFAINDLEGTKIKFQSNTIADDVYTITFSIATAEGYFLKDNMVDGVDGNDSLTAIVADGTYSFTQAISTTEERFEIVSNAEPQVLYYERAIATDGWGTICYPELITSVEGAIVYEIAGRDDAVTMIYAIPVAMEDMVKGKPYLFNATADAQKFFYDAEQKADMPAEDEYLVGTFEGMTVSGISYIIKDNLLWQAKDAHVAANRAYVDLEDIAEMDPYEPAPGAPVRRMMVAPRGAATDLQEVKAMNGTHKAMVNGRLVIIREGRMFNALGAMK